jgi:glycosyltransferase involved in cell wall biosynthesis
VSTLALVAARDEQERIGDTVVALGSVVDEIVVVDDGSRDATSFVAAEAGALVLRVPEGIGKGGALEGALARLDEPSDEYVLVDGDVGASAKEAAVLLDEVRSGRADLAIGVLPREPRHGGFRLVKRAAASAIRLGCGFLPEEPLSGQRALSRRAMEAVRPLSSGFGVEVGMTIDAVRAGLRVVEVPVAMEHAPTGRSPAAFVHRARQGLSLFGASVPRTLGLR